MPTTTDILNFCAVQMGRTTSTDFVLNSLDTGLWALNSARRNAERAHDFKFAETNLYVSIGSTGGILTACYSDTGLSVGPVGVKRVQSVLLPISGSGYQPIEFLTYETFTRRVRQQLGRQTFDATKTLAQLGLSAENPLAYQLGQTLFLYPASIAAPITAQIAAVQFMPDYTGGNTEDFFTDQGSEYLQWRTVLELNKYWKRFVSKQESNVDEDAVKALADDGLAALIAWDENTVRGTSAPTAQTQQQPA